jgi:hypothetical protein
MEEEVKIMDEHEEKPLDKMTVKELKVIAMDLPRTRSVHDMKKDELIAFIKEAKGIKKEPSATKGKDSAKLKSKQDMKAKIKDYKDQKTSALDQKDKKMANLLSRRISRLKKQTRKIAKT